MVGETINNDLKQMITTLGGSPEALEDNLLSTKLNKIIELLDEGGSGGSGGFEVKSITRTGTGNATNVIQFDHPVNAFSIGGARDDVNTYNVWLQPPHSTIDFHYVGMSMGIYHTPCTWSEDKKTLTINGENANVALNRADLEYCIVYM